MDNLLMPELRRLHEILRQEEEMLSPEEREKAHMEFVRHCEEIIKYSDVSRKEGLFLANVEGIFLIIYQKAKLRTWQVDLVKTMCRIPLPIICIKSLIWSGLGKKQYVFFH